MQQINIPPSPSGLASHSPIDVESPNKKRHTKKQIGADFTGRSVGRVTKNRAGRKSFLFRKCSVTDDFRSRKLMVDYVGTHLKYSDTSRSKHSVANMFVRLLVDELLKIPNNVHLPDACANGVVKKFVNECNSRKIQHSHSPGERRTTILEFIASELASYLPSESKVAGFDSKSEEIVKTIADKIVAENSIDISLPDGWERKLCCPVFSKDCRFYGYIADNNGMPRIYYRQKVIVIKNPDIPDCKPDQTLEEALSNAMLRLPFKADILNRKKKRIMIPRILCFEYSSDVQSQWQLALQKEKTAREELDKLMGCQVAEFLLEVQCTISYGRLDYNRVDSLTHGVNSILDWCNEGNNKEKLFQFLEGKHRGTKFVGEVAKVVEIFVENNDLSLIISIFNKIHGCKTVSKSAESNEDYVYCRWWGLRNIGAIEDKITMSCFTSQEDDEHRC